MEGIHVEHTGERIVWSLRRPLAATNLLDPAYHEWEKTAVPVRFCFDRQQMTGAIDSYLRTLRTLVAAQPKRFEWPICGFSVETIVNIDISKSGCIWEPLKTISFHPASPR